MLSVVRVLVVCVCFHQVFGRPKKHTVQKRWAYIENGDPQMRSIHTDCNKIVKEYADGDMPFYEYKAKMRKCMDRQERTNIPTSEDMDEFTPSFNLPRPAIKRFEMPRDFQQTSNSPQYYAYNYNNQYQDMYAPLEQRDNIASPPQAPQYSEPQAAQVYPSNYNYYPQTPPEQQQLTARSEIPSYQEPLQASMYDTTIVKKDKIPQPDEQWQTNE